MPGGSIFIPRSFGGPMLKMVIAGAAAAVTLSALTRAQAPQRLPGGLSARDVALYLDVALYEEAARQRLAFLPNQVLVKFRDGVTRAGALRPRPQKIGPGSDAAAQAFNVDEPVPGLSQM
jgi:hypothetical protein